MASNASIAVQEAPEIGESWLATIRAAPLSAMAAANGYTAHPSSEFSRVAEREDAGGDLNRISE
jgi:hypothetical protein